MRYDNFTDEEIRLAQAVRRMWDLHKDRHNLTQVKAAAALGMTQGAFSQMLNGFTPPSQNMVWRLSELLSVNPGDMDPSLAAFKVNTKPVAVTIDEQHVAIPGLLLAPGFEAVVSPDNRILIRTRDTHRVVAEVSAR